jgi:hypothetical protein
MEYEFEAGRGTYSTFLRIPPVDLHFLTNIQTSSIMRTKYDEREKRYEKEMGRK